MTHCPKCGTLVTIPASFCPDCGAVLSGEFVEENATTPTVDQAAPAPSITSPPSVSEGHGSGYTPGQRVGRGRTPNKRWMIAILAAAGILAASIGYLLTPSISPLATIRDSDGDGVVDAQDFRSAGDGGLLIRVDELEANGFFLILDGQITCTNPDFCPSSSFRMTTDVGLYRAAYVTNDSLSVDIPDDTEQVAFTIESAISGFIMNLSSEGRRVVEAPFRHTIWTVALSWTAPSGIQTLSGNLTYSLTGMDCPCNEDHRLGSPKAEAWPETPGPGTTPKAIGWAIQRSVDGTNWVVTLADVPAGLTPSAVSLVAFYANGTVALPKTVLPSLSGPVVYIPIDPAATYIAAGDRILLDTATYPAGTTIQLVDDQGVLASGTLQ